MTRENKLALVIGFGLILFIGILISDHFSVANNQATADLTDPRVEDPLFRRNPQEMVALVPEMYPDRNSNPAPVNASREAETAAPPISDSAAGTNVITTPDILAMQYETSRENARPQTPPRRERPAPPPAATRNYNTHHLADKETLTAVALKHYGSARFVEALAKFNGISDPNKVRAGHRLNLPDLEELVAATGDTSLLRIVDDTPTRQSSPPKPAYDEYEIQSGDMLSKLASRFMGTGAKWKELYELNKDVIDNPDKLKEGTVIRVPAR